ncbi:hypothetical protein F5878DRAFT_608463 [Lentinula raphanica]|uniref:Transmembrane protein n=1 Tax=Lentinula raphanica TaxID=153919 RepID=A0AA38PGA1_9AGAR|nr:hypothetical protein F5878DRAFT_608463 [Lentinula raphanica]
MGLVSSYEPLPQDIDSESEKSLTSESKRHRLGTIERYLVIIVLALALLNLLLALTTTGLIFLIFLALTPTLGCIWVCTVVGLFRDIFGLMF